MRQTCVAVLGTLAEFHREPIPYDLPALFNLVVDINPDFLCLDMTPAQWQTQRFDALPPEYVDVLLPLAHQTDMVVVPIGGKRLMPVPHVRGYRGRCIRQLRRLLAFVQRTAPGPDAINQGLRHHVADFAYYLIDLLGGRDRHRQQNERIAGMTQRIYVLARRDPGSRILVVVSVQYCHHIRTQLRAYADLQVTSYRDL